MGYIFRAFFAPMDRLQTAAGIPTKVPYLFATMMRRLLKNKDLPPGLRGGCVRRVRAHFSRQAFRLLQSAAPAHARRSAVQIPFVRRYCEAMRLPILEYPGYEADDVIGTLARQAAKKDLDIFIVTSDKDLMQLVADRVRL